MIEGQRVGKHVGADHGYSAKVNYKIPNINYNTALRSSSRPKMAEDKGFYGKRWLVRPLFKSFKLIYQMVEIWFKILKLMKLMKFHF